MKLSFKNKILMGLSAMCDEGVKKGGIPKQIQLSIKEGIELLTELHYLANDGESVSMVTIKAEKALEDLEDQFHPARIANMIKANFDPLTEQTKMVALGFWASGDLLLTYHHDMLVIPLIVDKPKDLQTGGWGSGLES